MSNTATSNTNANMDNNELFRSQQFLPTSFKPGKADVLLGRGKKCSNHEGNKQLRSIVASRLEQYSLASTKSEKSQILSAVVTQIRSGEVNGKFIKQDAETKLWFDVGDVLAKEKISQTFRDALVGVYRSSNEFKKKRRSEMKKEEKSSRAAKRTRIQPAASDYLSQMQPPASDYLSQMQYLLAYGSLNNPMAANPMAAFNSDASNLAALSRFMPSNDDPFNPSPIGNMSQMINNGMHMSLDSSLQNKDDKFSANDASRLSFDFRPSTNINSAKTA